MNGRRQEERSMSRVEENAKLRLPSGLRTDKEIWMAQAKFLEDISRSLAIIADAMSVPAETTTPIDDFNSKYGRRNDG